MVSEISIYVLKNNNACCSLYTPSIDLLNRL